jgi:hypothetical protein
VKLEDRERPYLDRMREQVQEMPDDEGKLISQMMGEVDTTKFVPAEYELAGA